MNSATFDPARNLTLYFRCNRAGSKNFVFVRSNGSAYSFIYTDDLELNIYRNQGDKKKLISLTYISGLVLNSNTLTASITSALSNINEGEYYWELYRTDLEKTWLCGDAIFHNGKFDGVENDSETITVTEDGEDILITIQEGPTAATQSEVNAGSGSGYVTPETLAAYTDPARVQTVVSAATVTPSADSDDEVKVTSQAQSLIIANPSGTPTDGQGICINLKDNGVQRAITFGDKYRAFSISLPTVTTAGKWMRFAVIYNSTDEEWDVLPYVVEI